MNEAQDLWEAEGGGLVKMTKTKEQIDRIKMMQQVAAQRERKKERRQADSSEVQAGSITVEAYEELKRVGMTDANVMKKFNMHSANFYDWKNKNGLIRRKRADATKVEKNPIPTINSTKSAEKEPKSAEKVQVPKTEKPKLIVKEKYDAIEKELSELYQKHVALGDKHEELSVAHEKACAELQTAKKVSASIAAYYEDRSKEEAEKTRMTITDSEADAAKQKVEELQVRVRELEEDVAIEINEKNKNAAECFQLSDERRVLRKEIDFLQDENKRLHRLKTYLYEDNLKVIEQVGLRLEGESNL